MTLISPIADADVQEQLVRDSLASIRPALDPWERDVLDRTDVRVVAGSNECGRMRALNPRACAFVDKEGKRHILIAGSFIDLADRVIQMHSLLPYFWALPSRDEKSPSPDIESKHNSVQPYRTYLAFAPPLESILSSFDVKRVVELANEDNPSHPVHVESESEHAHKLLLDTTEAYVMPRMSDFIARAAVNGEPAKFQSCEQPRTYSDTRTQVFRDSVTRLANAVGARVIERILERIDASLPSDSRVALLSIHGSSMFTACDADVIVQECLPDCLPKKRNADRILMDFLFYNIIAPAFVETLNETIKTAARSINAEFANRPSARKGDPYAKGTWLLEYVDYATAMYLANARLLSDGEEELPYLSAADYLQREREKRGISDSRLDADPRGQQLLRVRHIVNYLILHELGHHLLGHTDTPFVVILSNPERLVEQEQQADFWAQKALVKVKGSLIGLVSGAIIDSALDAHLRDASEPTTHPQYKDRTGSMAETFRWVLAISPNQDSILRDQGTFVQSKTQIYLLIESLSRCGVSRSLRECLVH